MTGCIQKRRGKGLLTFPASEQPGSAKNSRQPELAELSIPGLHLPAETATPCGKDRQSGSRPFSAEPGKRTELQFYKHLFNILEKDASILSAGAVILRVVNIGIGKARDQVDAGVNDPPLSILAGVKPDMV